MFQNAAFAMNRKRVFDSVFSPTSLNDITPTPVATPALAPTGPGQSFGSVKRPGDGPPALAEQHDPLVSVTGNENSVRFEESSPEAIIRDRAWHVATTFLSLPNRGFEILARTDDAATLLRSDVAVSQETSNALAYLLSSSSRERSRLHDAKELDLIEWYGYEMRRHFLTNFRTGFAKVCRLG
jgi:anaphase-promoting complex subunit 2